MKVTLANGTQLTAVGVRGETVYFQGASRDCLTFLFDPASNTMQGLDKAFTPANCSQITLEDDAGTYIHNGYVIRKSLEKTIEEAPGGGPNPPERKEYIYVRMAQISYLEQMQADLADAVDLLIINSLEV